MSKALAKVNCELLLENVACIKYEFTTSHLSMYDNSKILENRKSDLIYTA